MSSLKSIKEVNWQDILPVQVLGLFYYGITSGYSTTDPSGCIGSFRVASEYLE